MNTANYPTQSTNATITWPKCLTICYMFIYWCYIYYFLVVSDITELKTCIQAHVQIYMYLRDDQCLPCLTCIWSLAYHGPWFTYFKPWTAHKASSYGTNTVSCSCHQPFEWVLPFNHERNKVPPPPHTLHISGLAM